jgi:3',5'-cyclic AMP phosphodiesterase CpdA
MNIKYGLFPIGLMVGLLFVGCEVDYLGLFYSTDVEERLEAADEFALLADNACNGTPWRDALDTGAPPYSFVFVTDTHIEGDNAADIADLGQAFVESDKFVVVGGDIAQSGRRVELQAFLDAAHQWKRHDGQIMPCYPVIGNHDIYFGNWKVWRELIGSTRYRVDSPNGGISIIVLDSANATFSANQLDWLQTQLNTAAINTFVFSHDSLFKKTNPLDPGKNLPAAERARVVSLVSGCGNVKAYIAGHIHQNITHQVNSVHYLTQEDYKSHQSYLRVTVNANGAVEYTRYTL